MTELTCLGLVIEFYSNMLESILNLGIIFIKLRGIIILVAPEIILSVQRPPNIRIVIREMRNYVKPHLEYDREYGLPHDRVGKKLSYYMGKTNIYVQYAMAKVLLQKHHDQHIMSTT